MDKIEFIKQQMSDEHPTLFANSVRDYRKGQRIEKYLG